MGLAAWAPDLGEGGSNSSAWLLVRCTKNTAWTPSPWAHLPDDAAPGGGVEQKGLVQALRVVDRQQGASHLQVPAAGATGGQQNSPEQAQEGGETNA